MPNSQDGENESSDNMTVSPGMKMAVTGRGMVERGDGYPADEQ